MPDIAVAHSPIEGVNDFYNGLLHPVFVPAHLMLLVGLGLFLGLQGDRRVDAVLSVFFVATVVGLMASGVGGGMVTESFVLIWAVLVGLLIAAAPTLAPALCWAIVAVAGVLLGFDSAQAELSGRPLIMALAGSGVGICLLPLYPMMLVGRFAEVTWLRLGVRIIGSWIAASALLTLALSLVSTR